MGSAGALPIWNCPRVIFLMTLSDTLLISAHKAVVSERKKILYNFLIWSADSGSSLSISCALQLDFICCLPAHKWESCIILHLDHRYSSEMCLVPFLNDQWNRDCATETNHSEKQFSSLHFFNFPATPLHSSTISSCPQRRLQDKNTLHISKICLTLGSGKPVTDTDLLCCKELSFTNSPSFQYKERETNIALTESK